ncbi:phage holin family protein [Streptomyces calidiresistens]|uniref:Phage holin family protein n=1 Tax=Streptomyces calidiresistens TaxID=1485586 RepID=A0A7W3T603_9ACTN|nr:phage holin family protein [Streptomyces calidiresistens]
MSSVSPESRGTHQAEPREKHEEDASVGELLAAVTSDVQTLFRQEIELAKTEVREEAVKAGRAAGMFGGAGFAGWMVAIFLSLAAVLGLANVMDGGWAALIVTAVWAAIGGVLFVLGRSRMREVSPKPERTVETLKEDAQWARHPTG